MLILTASEDEQRLFILAYQLETAPLVRLITRIAYELGSPLVTVLWNDDGVAKIRQRHAPAGSFEEFPAWILEGPYQSLSAGAAYLQIDGRDPRLLEGQDPQNLAVTRKTMVKHYKPISRLQGIHAMQWTVVAAATPGWARRRLQKDSPNRLKHALCRICFLAAG